MKSILTLSLFLFLSCSDDSFKKVDKLGEFRVLGIQASSPEVAPGDSVTINLLLSDKNAGGRTINVVVEDCIDPGICYGAQPSCDNSKIKNSFIQSIDTSTLGASFTGVPPGIPITIPASILTGRNARDQFNGVAYLVTFTFDVDGEKIKTFKRVLATNRAALNANPTVNQATDLLLNGIPLNQIPSSGDKLSISALAAESYQFQNIDGSIDVKAEEFEVAWYTDEGEFSKPKSYVEEQVEFKNESSNDPSVLVVVIRDGRGGLSYLIEEFP